MFTSKEQKIRDAVNLIKKEAGISTFELNLEKNEMIYYVTDEKKYSEFIKIILGGHILDEWI